MSEIRPSRYTHFIPGVPFRVNPDFRQFDRDPVGFRKKALAVEFGEGVRVDRIGLKVGRRPVGLIDVIEYYSGADKSDYPTVFPGGDIRPFAIFLALQGIEEQEAEQTTIDLIFRGQHYNALISDPDSYEATGITSVYQYLWVKSGHKEKINLGFRRSELPEIDFLIKGIQRPSRVEVLLAKTLTFWEKLSQP